MFRHRRHKMTFAEACETLGIKPEDAARMGWWRRRSMIRTAQDVGKRGMEGFDPNVGGATELPPVHTDSTGFI